MSKINYEYGYRQGVIPCRIYKNYSSENHDYLSNWHNEPEFIYVVSGSVVVYIESDCYVAHPGDIVMISGNRVHTFAGQNWSFHCIIPAEQIFESLEISHRMFRFEPVIRDETLSAAFLNIIKERDEERTYSKQFVTLAIQHFVLQVFEKYGTHPAISDEQKQNNNFMIAVKVTDYLRQHLSENFSIDVIAQGLDISTSHMCRCFKAAMGVSIIDHLNRLRCYTARHYLMHTNKKVNEVAALCGYQNNSYFTRTYQKIVGYPPNETPRESPQKGSN